MSKLYLAHPISSRHDLRQWELHLENSLDIEIVNPFYDLSRDDIALIDAGLMDRFGVNPEQIVERDLEALYKCDGVIAYINGEPSYGTIMEIVYACLVNIPVYAIVTNGYELHPWLRYHCTEIFTDWAVMEAYLGEVA